MKDTETQAYQDVLKDLDAAVSAADTAANIFPIQIGGSARYKAAILHARTVARDAVKHLNKMENQARPSTSEEFLDLLTWIEGEMVANRELGACSKMTPDTREAIERTPGKDIAFRKVRAEIVRRLDTLSQ